MTTRFFSVLALPLVAIYVPTCVPVAARMPIDPPDPPNVAELWERPDDLAVRDLFNGPWGEEHAPDPRGTYTFVETKTGGINPGMTVRDRERREWKIKQAPTDGRGAEGPIEVVLSRVLAAVGYHQPPVYFLKSFRLDDDAGTRVEAGGRFRLKVKRLKDRGEWSWQENPFVGTKPYQGLLVILLMFNSSDLKNSNNTLYESRGRTVGSSSGTSCAISARRSAVRDALNPCAATRPCSSVSGSSKVSRTGSWSSSTAAGTRSSCASASRRTMCDGRRNCCRRCRSTSGTTRFAPAATTGR